MFFNNIWRALAIAFFFAVGSSAHAALVGSGPTYCNSGLGDIDPTTNGSTPVQKTSDMKYGSQNATDCYGLAPGNDDPAAINALAWGTGWSLLARDNIGNDPDVSNTIFGIQWSLSAGFDPKTWVLTGTDVNGSAPANLGDTFDFIGVLKGGNGYAAYLFDNVVYTGTTGGIWEITFENMGGQIPNLSHMSMHGRFGGSPPNEVPEPGTLAAAGLSLLGLAFFRRRQPR